VKNVNREHGSEERGLPFYFMLEFNSKYPIPLTKIPL